MSEIFIYETITPKSSCCCFVRLDVQLVHCSLELHSALHLTTHYLRVQNLATSHANYAIKICTNNPMQIPNIQWSPFYIYECHPKWMSYSCQFPFLFNRSLYLTSSTCFTIRKQCQTLSISISYFIKYIKNLIVLFPYLFGSSKGLSLTKSNSHLFISASWISRTLSLANWPLLGSGDPNKHLTALWRGCPETLGTSEVDVDNSVEFLRKFRPAPKINCLGGLAWFADPSGKLPLVGRASIIIVIFGLNTRVLISKTGTELTKISVSSHSLPLLSTALTGLHWPNKLVPSTTKTN